MSGELDGVLFVADNLLATAVAVDGRHGVLFMFAHAPSGTDAPGVVYLPSDQAARTAARDAILAAFDAAAAGKGMPI